MGSVQTRRPTCWYPPGDRPRPSCQLYDPQSRRPPCWEPPPRRASREYSDSSYVLPWQPRFTNVESSSIYGQPHFTNKDSSYVPPRQYKTSTIRQPTYPAVSDDGNSISGEKGGSLTGELKEGGNATVADSYGRETTSDKETSYERLKSEESVKEKTDENVGVKGEAEQVVKHEVKTEEEDIEWDEIEDIGSDNDKKDPIGERPHREELRTQIVKSLEEGKSDDDDDGDFLRVKSSATDEEDEEDGNVLGEKMNEYFGDDEKLDNEEMFLKDYFRKRGWIDEGKSKGHGDVDVNISEEELKRFTNVQKFDGDYYVRRRLPIWRAFDPGGDASPKLLLPTIVVAS